MRYPLRGNERVKLEGKRGKEREERGDGMINGKG